MMAAKISEAKPMRDGASEKEEEEEEEEGEMEEEK